MNQKQKGKYIGMAGALLVHVVFILLLILVGFSLPEPEEEGGVPVMLGEVPDAFGAADPSLVKVDVMPEEPAPPVQESVEQEIITQETEETVVIQPKTDANKKEEVKKKPVKP
ncbi:MAG: energy transducer TonB, partial [Bacteroides sp.]|nr:energy transducer TonB [Bacteroides sp.]